MSISGEITLDWGGEPERTFRLGIGQIKKLQDAVNAGPLGIAARCQITAAALAYQRQRDWISLSQLNLSHMAEITHVREALRQGLLGANMPMPQADRLIREYVDERPLDENLVAAIQVCMAHVYGTEDEKPAGESRAAAAASPNSPTGNTVSEKTDFTPSAPPADLATPERSTP